MKNPPHLGAFIKSEIIEAMQTSYEIAQVRKRADAIDVRPFVAAGGS